MFIEQVFILNRFLLMDYCSNPQAVQPESLSRELMGYRVEVYRYKKNSFLKVYS
jgi:hypothetical protein